MYDDRLKELESISQAVGNSPDMVQGGGGNTSVKLDDEFMAVKASGFKLNQITLKDGYVTINYKNIKEYYSKVDLNSGIDYEKDSVEYAKRNVVRSEGMKELRPSVEAGFHSILMKYVIHTHPVYANILCCSTDGKAITDKIFNDKEYGHLWIPYINPGFSLTLKIQEALKEFIAVQGKIPEIIFMENHGLIVNSDDWKKCIDLHSRVNMMIKEYLCIKEDFPKISIEAVDENNYKSRTGYLTDYFKDSKISADFFDTVVLYPDQLVYLNGCISLDGSDSKLNIDIKTGELKYKTNCNEALTIEETLLAYLYVINKVRECGLQLKTMSPEEINFIRNWESERYRKSLVAGK